MMKKYFTFLFFCFSIIIFAQNLTLSDLLALRKKDIAEVDEYLTNKKWSFLEAEEPSDEILGSLTYAFGKSNYDDEALSFIKYYYSNYSTTKRIGIQIHKSSILNVFVNQIKSWGGKLYNSYVDDGAIIKIYRGSTMTYKVHTDTQSSDYGGTNTIYTLVIYTNEDFDLNS
ncbi:hypothetical protein SAMN05443634_106197 [Chishuiella changwenlii]|uniref:Uncharacterized protein n=1 Tax=Chishuiella changwenlii TaxID=1434701 RepID=A0A1M6YCT2_9FLAO|nr:hypothetical protein [Chishuiella changwenlii]GGE97643.1 hypothetical protein GCM10010984_14030 [Chishuiella changwenlii]SHL16116.1 hypothetical protein SAMN05443634_106197 [Chishuiella changwenlii]